ncbi:MAG: hypothetical protein HYX34_05465 [Actinobacteria bacterium]|nr:hypothetical protein [Actinomycetota bacterium]
MTTLLVLHEVDDVDHWLASPKREEFFGPKGLTARTFVDPNGSKRVGLIVETPDLATFENALQSEGAQDAMKHDGVRPDTIQVLVEG